MGESHRKSKKKKHKRSRSRSHSRTSRKKRSRSRSKDKRKKRSYSRDRKRSRSRERKRSRDRRSRSRDRRSRSKDRRRSHSRSSDVSKLPKVNEEVEIVKETGSNPVDMMSIAENLKRARAITDIESESFVQQDFKSTRDVGNIPIPSDNPNGEFEFGTSVEVKSKAEDDLEKLAKEGLINPLLFGDQEAREQRYLQHMWTIRQRALQKMSA